MKPSGISNVSFATPSQGSNNLNVVSLLHWAFIPFSVVVLLCGGRETKVKTPGNIRAWFEIWAPLNYQSLKPLISLFCTPNDRDSSLLLRAQEFKRTVITVPWRPLHWGYKFCLVEHSTILHRVYILAIWPTEKLLSAYSMWKLSDGNWELKNAAQLAESSSLCLSSNKPRWTIKKLEGSQILVFVSFDAHSLDQRESFVPNASSGLNI